MDRFEATRTFVRVVQTGSFSAAARREGTTQSAVSKKVGALEKHLDCQLLVRNSRTLSITQAGDEYYRRCRSILEEFEAAETAARGARASLRSTLQVSMSPVLSRLVLAPILAEFSTLHPQLSVSLELTERHCDLIVEGIDVVVRAAELEESSLVARRLSSNPFMLAAAPAYLARKGRPEHPGELARHECLVFSRLKGRHIWRFTRRGETVDIDAGGNIVGDQGDTLVELAALGCGIVMMPAWVMREHLNDGRLEPLLEGWRCPALPLQLVYPKTKHVPSKIRRFSDFVYTEIRRRKVLPR